MGKTQVNNFGISGKVIYVGMPWPIPGSGNLMKRVLVIEGWVKSKYKQEIAFDFVNDNMDQLNNIREGDWVNIDFHIRGRKNVDGQGKARWYTNLEGTNCTVDRD